MRTLTAILILFILPGISQASLRDSDIFIIQYTADYVSHNRPGVDMPAGTSELWPDTLVKVKTMLNEIKLKIKQSAFKDPAGKFAPDTNARTDFIIDQTFSYLVKSYGPAFAMKGEIERTEILLLIAEEFQHHQNESIKYPTGEPVHNGMDFTWTEQTKIGTKTKYNKTRIYQK